MVIFLWDIIKFCFCFLHAKICCYLVGGLLLNLCMANILEISLKKASQGFVFFFFFFGAPKDGWFFLALLLHLTWLETASKHLKRSTTLYYKKELLLVAASHPHNYQYWTTYSIYWLVEGEFALLNKFFPSLKCLES